MFQPGAGRLLTLSCQEPAHCREPPRPCPVQGVCPGSVHCLGLPRSSPSVGTFTRGSLAICSNTPRAHRLLRRVCYVPRDWKLSPLGLSPPDGLSCLPMSSAPSVWATIVPSPCIPCLPPALIAPIPCLPAIVSPIPCLPPSHVSPISRLPQLLSPPSPCLPALTAPLCVVPSPHAVSHRSCPGAGGGVCFRHFCWPGHGVFKRRGSAPAAAKTQAGTVGHSFIPLLPGEGHACF